MIVDDKKKKKKKRERDRETDRQKKEKPMRSTKSERVRKRVPLADERSRYFTTALFSFPPPSWGGFSTLVASIILLEINFHVYARNRQNVLTL